MPFLSHKAGVRGTAASKAIPGDNEPRQHAAESYRGAANIYGNIWMSFGKEEVEGCHFVVTTI